MSTRGSVARAMSAHPPATSRVGSQYQATEIPPLPPNQAAERDPAEELPCDGDERLGSLLWSPESWKLSCGEKATASELEGFLQAVAALPAPGAPKIRLRQQPRPPEPEPEPKSPGRNKAPGSPDAGADEQDAAQAGKSTHQSPPHLARFPRHVSDPLARDHTVAEAIARALPASAVPVYQEEALSALHAAGYKITDALAGLENAPGAPSIEHEDSSMENEDSSMEN